MAESDPRKIRPFGKTSDRRDFDSEEDPLVELARIVSEDRGAQGSRPVRPSPSAEPTPRSPYSADLEAELLHELESSFSPRAPARPAAAVRAAAQSASHLEPEDDHLLRSIESQMGDYERRAPTPHDRAGRRSDEDRAESGDTPYSGQGGWEPVAATPFPRVDPRQAAPAAPAEPRAGERRPARAAEEQQVRRPAADRPISNSEHDMSDDEPSSRLPLRRRDRPDAPDVRSPQAPRAAASALPAAGWTNVIGSDERNAGRNYRDSGDQDRRVHDPADYRDDLRASFDGNDEPRAAARRQPVGSTGFEGEYVSELEPTYSDPTFGAQWEGDQSGLDGDVSDEPRVAPARASGSGVTSAARQPGRASRKGLMAAAGVLGVLVIGGAVLGLMRTGEEAPSGPPPVISAPAGETKVAAPEQEQAEGQTAGEAVYNRVAGAAPSGDEQVVDGAEEPREISRIVLPPPQAESDDALVKAVGDETAANIGAEGNTAIEPVAIGPRRVRTYIVRPDGTITASGAAPAPAPAPARPAAAVSTPIEPVRVATTSVRVGDAPAIGGTPNPVPVTGAAPVPAPATVAPEPQPSAEVEPAPRASAPAVTQSNAAAPEPAPPPQPIAAEPATQEPAQVASVAPAEPAPAPAAAAPRSGGYVMQVSSQRSRNEAQSALAAAQQRYGSIIGNLETEVQEADLGEKGVYYRARVGRWESRAEAVEVCEALQAVGGSCFVTQ